MEVWNFSDLRCLPFEVPFEGAVTCDWEIEISWGDAAEFDGESIAGLLEGLEPATGEFLRSRLEAIPSSWVEALPGVDIDAGEEAIPTQGLVVVLFEGPNVAGVRVPEDAPVELALNMGLLDPSSRLWSSTGLVAEEAVALLDLALCHERLHVAHPSSSEADILARQVTWFRALEPARSALLASALEKVEQPIDGIRRFLGLVQVCRSQPIQELALRDALALFVDEELIPDCIFDREDWGDELLWWPYIRARLAPSWKELTTPIATPGALVSKVLWSWPAVGVEIVLIGFSSLWLFRDEERRALRSNQPVGSRLRAIRTRKLHAVVRWTRTVFTAFLLLLGALWLKPAWAFRVLPNSMVELIGTHLGLEDAAVTHLVDDLDRESLVALSRHDHGKLHAKIAGELVNRGRFAQEVSERQIVLETLLEILPEARDQERQSTHRNLVQLLEEETHPGIRQTLGRQAVVLFGNSDDPGLRALVADLFPHLPLETWGASVEETLEASEPVDDDTVAALARVLPTLRDDPRPVSRSLRFAIASRLVWLYEKRGDSRGLEQTITELWQASPWAAAEGAEDFQAYLDEATAAGPADHPVLTELAAVLARSNDPHADTFLGILLRSLSRAEQQPLRRKLDRAVVSVAEQYLLDRDIEVRLEGYGLLDRLASVPGSTVHPRVAEILAGRLETSDRPRVLEALVSLLPALGRDSTAFGSSDWERIDQVLLANRAPYLAFWLLQLQPSDRSEPGPGLRGLLPNSVLQDPTCSLNIKVTGGEAPACSEDFGVTVLELLGRRPLSMARSPRGPAFGDLLGESFTALEARRRERVETALFDLATELFDSPFMADRRQGQEALSTLVRLEGSRVYLPILRFLVQRFEGLEGSKARQLLVAALEEPHSLVRLSNAEETTEIVTLLASTDTPFVEPFVTAMLEQDFPHASESAAMAMIMAGLIAGESRAITLADQFIQVSESPPGSPERQEFFTTLLGIAAGLGSDAGNAEDALRNNVRRGHDADFTAAVIQSLEGGGEQEHRLGLRMLGRQLLERDWRGRAAADQAKLMADFMDLLEGTSDLALVRMALSNDFWPAWTEVSDPRAIQVLWSSTYDLVQRPDLPIPLRVQGLRRLSDFLVFSLQRPVVWRYFRGPWESFDREEIEKLRRDTVSLFMEHLATDSERPMKAAAFHALAPHFFADFPDGIDGLRALTQTWIEGSESLEQGLAAVHLGANGSAVSYREWRLQEYIPLLLEFWKALPSLDAMHNIDLDRVDTLYFPESLGDISGYLFALGPGSLVEGLVRQDDRTERLEDFAELVPFWLMHPEDSVRDMALGLVGEALDSSEWHYDYLELPIVAMLVQDAGFEKKIRDGVPSNSKFYGFGSGDPVPWGELIDFFTGRTALDVLVDRHGLQSEDRLFLNVLRLSARLVMGEPPEQRRALEQLRAIRWSEGRDLDSEQPVEMAWVLAASAARYVLGSDSSEGVKDPSWVLDLLSSSFELRSRGFLGRRSRLGTVFLLSALGDWVEAGCDACISESAGVLRGLLQLMLPRGREGAVFDRLEDPEVVLLFTALSKLVRSHPGAVDDLELDFDRVADPRSGSMSQRDRTGIRVLLSPRTSPVISGWVQTVISSGSADLVKHLRRTLRGLRSRSPWLVNQLHLEAAGPLFRRLWDPEETVDEDLRVELHGLLFDLCRASRGGLGGEQLFAEALHFAVEAPSEDLFENLYAETSLWFWSANDGLRDLLIAILVDAANSTEEGAEWKIIEERALRSLGRLGLFGTLELDANGLEEERALHSKVASRFDLLYYPALHDQIEEGLAELSEPNDVLGESILLERKLFDFLYPRLIRTRDGERGKIWIGWHSLGVLGVLGGPWPVESALLTRQASDLVSIIAAELDGIEDRDMLRMLWRLLRGLARHQWLFEDEAPEAPGDEIPGLLDLIQKVEDRLDRLPRKAR